jgi:hypothetical protein
MPNDITDQEAARRAKEDAAQGKSPSTQAGEFVREEMHHVREGKHGARSPQQAIAIGLSKARRTGVKLAPPGRGQGDRTRRQAQRDLRKGRSFSSRNIQKTLPSGITCTEARRPFSGFASEFVAAGATRCEAAWLPFSPPGGAQGRSHQRSRGPTKSGT